MEEAPPGTWKKFCGLRIGSGDGGAAKPSPQLADVPVETVEARPVPPPPPPLHRRATSASRSRPPHLSPWASSNSLGNEITRSSVSSPKSVGTMLAKSASMGASDVVDLFFFEELCAHKGQDEASEWIRSWRQASPKNKSRSPRRRRSSTVQELAGGLSPGVEQALSSIFRPAEGAVARVSGSAEMAGSKASSRDTLASAAATKTPTPSFDSSRDCSTRGNEVSFDALSSCSSFAVEQHAPRRRRRSLSEGGHPSLEPPGLHLLEPVGNPEPELRASSGPHMSLDSLEP